MEQLDCGGQGNCLFLCIANVFGTEQSVIRDKLSKFPEKWFDKIKNYYLIYKTGNWSRDDLTIQKFREIVKTSGSLYQGDDLSLKLISCMSHIGFIVYKDYKIHCDVMINKNTTHVIVLLHLGNPENGHWVLLHKNNKKLFALEETPNEIINDLKFYCNCSLDYLKLFPNDFYI